MIREIQMGMKVNGEEVKEVTRTKTEDKTLVIIKAGSLMKNMPLEDMQITKGHKVLYKNKMTEAKYLENGKKTGLEE